MPQRDAAPNGAPCWVDLLTSDLDTSRSFYEALFGWTSEDAGDEYGGYVNFSKDGMRVAGCMLNDGEAGMPDVWSVYLATGDAEATCKAADANGGQVHLRSMEVGELGSMALLADSGGAAIGVWQPGSHKGFTVLGETGTPAWFELHTRDYEKSIRFYQDVFEWNTSVASDTPEFRYTTLGEGEGSLAGIMDASAFLPPGVPAHWSVYFGVDDTGAALAKVVELGGSIISEAVDTPHGRLATAADPTGAQFKIVAPA